MRAVGSDVRDTVNGPGNETAAPEGGWLRTWEGDHVRYRMMMTVRQMRSWGDVVTPPL